MAQLTETFSSTHYPMQNQPSDAAGKSSGGMGQGLQMARFSGSRSRNEAIFVAFPGSQVRKTA
jgi:hypothetical protein